MHTELLSTPTDVENLDPKKYIIIKGAKVNNLKNLTVAIPRNQLVVITGVSGSGKSSLAFDTLFAEGQRMYVESLSSYARQFLGRMEKPEVEYIRGIAPAIAVEQKVSVRNPRSTVGTTTEIYDYLKLFFARIGKTYSPISGTLVRKDTVSDVVDFISGQELGTKYMILSPLRKAENRILIDEMKVLLQKGFTRIRKDTEILFIEQFIQENENVDKKTLKSLEKSDYSILIDRSITAEMDEEGTFRLADSVQTAFLEGMGTCIVEISKEGELYPHPFSDRFEADGMIFEEPTINFFSFNNSYGACRRCEGFGNILGIDADLVFPDKSLSCYDDAIAPWRTEKMREWLQPLLKNAYQFDFPIHRAIEDLTKEEYELLWTGNEYFKGLNDFFEYVNSQLQKVQYRVLLSKYRGRQVCPDCKGTRIRKEASYVKIGGKSITDLVLMPISELAIFFDGLSLLEHESKVARRLLIEIQNRLGYLQQVGLGYLTLNRLTETLSGGEFQRIKLATSLGSALVGSMYILDEPSIGLHPRDTQNLIQVLLQLRNIGNTVIVVEHEEEVMRAADQIIDIGLDAGVHGGTLIFQGSLEEIKETEYSHTARYLSGKEKIDIPTQRRKWIDYIEVQGAKENNLKNIDVKFPLGVLTVITGVSGSGKSTLVKKILSPALAKFLGKHEEETGKMNKLAGNLKRISQVEFIDQNPIGKSSRSNPVTYIKAYDAIRQYYAELPLSKQREYKPAFFSFNVDGGRCEACEGDGTVKIEMQFMADIYLKCEHCNGMRFKKEVLDVQYKEKNIAQILEMTVEEAIVFFAELPKIADKLKPLQEVGLGYIRLGQSSSSLSGGEAQRVKLAYFLGKGRKDDEHILFVFDEPTTGLHFHDINKLLKSINALIDHGHTAIVIEHNMEVIKTADWIIDLGQEGGEKGGYVCFEGTPEEMLHCTKGYTAQFLKEKLK